MQPVWLCNFPCICFEDTSENKCSKCDYALSLASNLRRHSVNSINLIQLLEYMIPPPPPPWPKKTDVMVLSHVKPCCGVSPCYGVSPWYGASPCYGVSLCFGVSPCYGVSLVMSPWRGSHGLNARRARRTKSRGPKGLQLEVGARRALRHLVKYIAVNNWTSNSLVRKISLTALLFLSIDFAC